MFPSQSVRLPRWPLGRIHKLLGLYQHRGFSVKVGATYSAFPHKLHHYASRSTSSLFDSSHLHERPLHPHDEAINVAKDGLIYPSTGSNSTGGAIMMPNTFYMQELVRGYLDDVFERQDEGEDVATPFIYTIPTGTPLPSHLILTHEYQACFCLQPLSSMSLSDFNNALNEFYHQHASKEPAEDWIDRHPFHEAFADDSPTEWKP